jgi:CubicO group peptidase (beta-lactamase class C family)
MIIFKKSRFVLLVLISHFILLFGNTATSGEQTEYDLFDDFEEFVDDVMEQWNVPGLAIGVVKDNKVIYMKGFGYQDVEKNVPVNTKTIFSIGSCTKAFTATAIGMLVDDGNLKWNTPINEFLPDFQFYDPYATAHLNPKDLLLHRTGLRGHNKVHDISPLSRDSLYKIIRYLEPNIGFRENFQYANLNYQIAGYLVDKLSGDSFEQYITNRIFKPLGMTNSTFFIDDRQAGSNIAHPYMNFGAHDNWGEAVLNTHYFSMSKASQGGTAPSGGIYSNVEDMVEWIKLNLNGGAIDDHQIISAENLQIIHTPYMGIKYYPDDKMSPFYAFGMGWSISPFQGFYFLRHDGQMYGYMADVSFMPYENIGVVILTNMYYHHVCSIVSENVYERILGLEVTNNSTSRYNSFMNASNSLEKGYKEFWPDQSKTKKPTQSISNYKGIYENPGYGKIVINCQNDRGTTSALRRRYICNKE